MTDVRLYLRYMGISLRGQMQYKVSFLLQSLGQFLATGIEFVGLWALFERFGQVRGWHFNEAALFYGHVHVTFAIADAFTRGFDVFGTFVKQGDFDRILVRPRSTVLQLAGHELTLRRIGRLLQGTLILIWALSRLGPQLSPHWPLVLFLGALGGVGLFFGVIVLQATMAFWTIESLEIMNTITYGGVETAQFPLSIYRRFFRRFFIFVVPIACVAYFPVVSALNRPDPLGTPVWLGWVSPLAGIGFLALSLVVWQIGVRHYTSTGS